MPDGDTPLRILHVLRAPIGGLFRHVADLARAQAAAGHAVGLVADSLTGGDHAADRLAALEPDLALGLTRTPMPRVAGPTDLGAARHVATRAKGVSADIVHGHGAKGGAYARLVGRRRARLYTPHGGSLNYDPRSASGRVFHALERLLLPRTEAILFESAHARASFETMIGRPPPASAVVVNGLLDADFAPIPFVDDPADFVFIGELRMLKGVDVLLEALASLAADGLAPRLLVVGDGPDEAAFRTLATRLGLETQIAFAGRRTAAEAFAGGACVVMPSRKESMPYVVLEAVAAARPIIATRVGGIPEILPDAALIAPGSAAELAAAMGAHLGAPARRLAEAEAMRDRVRTSFSAARMAREVEAVYRRCLDASG